MMRGCKMPVNERGRRVKIYRNDLKVLQGATAFIMPTLYKVHVE